MSPHDGNPSSSERPTGNGCPNVLEMVSPRRQAWQLGRGLDQRVGNSQILPVQRHLLVARLSALARGPPASFTPGMNSASFACNQARAERNTRKEDRNCLCSDGQRVACPLHNQVAARMLANQTTSVHKPKRTIRHGSDLAPSPFHTAQECADATLQRIRRPSANLNCIHQRNARPIRGRHRNVSSSSHHS